MSKTVKTYGMRTWQYLVSPYSFLLIYIHTHIYIYVYLYIFPPKLQNLH